MTASATDIHRDLPCLRCGYNLRTLSKDARCPECGLEVFTTLAGGLPVVDTVRRRRVLGVGCLSLVFTAIALVAAPKEGHGGFAHQAVPFVDPGLAYIPAALFAAIAMVAFSRPQALLDGSPLFVRSRRVMLAGAPAMPLAIVLWEYAYRWVPFDDFGTRKTLLFIPLVAFAPGVLLAFRMLGRLVRPLGLPAFRKPLAVVTAGWWVTTPVVTWGLVSALPPFGFLNDLGSWIRHPTLRQFYEAFAAAGAVVVFCGVFAACLIGFAVLVPLTLALFGSRPPAVPLTLPAGVPADHGSDVR